MPENPLKEKPTPPKKQKQCEPCPAGAPFYMATFSDVSNLADGFFIALLSMTEVD